MHHIVSFRTAAEEGGWSSLPADLVNLVADRFLATNDLDYYMNLRAVCHGWRSATADPWSNQQHDPRFRPNRWLMLKEEEGHTAAESSAAAASSSSSSRILFFNVTNGRILRMSRLPQLIRDYILISATTCGLLVLAARSCPHAVRVLNPFTGSWTSFKVRVTPGTLPANRSASAAMVGPSPTLVLAIDDVSWSCSVTVYWADRQSKSFSVETRKGCSPTMLPLIAASKCAAAAAADHRDSSAPSSADACATTINIFNLLASTKNYLCDTVELADGGYMLAVLTRLLPRDYATVVFTVDSAGNVMEQVKSIGSHALFLGSSRCLSVTAEAFPAHTIEANRIHNLNFVSDRCRVYKFGTRREHAQQAQWLAPLFQIIRNNVQVGGATLWKKAWRSRSSRRLLS
jgi:hypothetical protein